MDSYRKRTPDYTDFAYREAVSKLRYLLAESYTSSVGPTKFSLGPHHHHHHPFVKLPDGDEQRESSLVLQSRHSAGCGAPKRPDTGGVQPPAELMSFIERQEEYIEQLEKESQYCREELANLMGKVKEVISENEGLHERRKSSLLRSVFDSFEMDDDEEEETEQEDKSECQRSERTHKRKHLTGPNIVFESRISELEAQLTQTKMDLRKALDEAETYKKKCNDRSVNPLDGTMGSDAHRQIEMLQRERDELNENVNRLHAALAQLREKEASASQKVKRSLDLVDQAQFEKNQAEIEVRRLKSELERVSEKQRESLAEQSRRVAEVERRYTAQTEQLSADLAAQWDNATKLSLELEKQRRVESDLRRELAQRNSTIDELKKEFNAKTSNLQSELLSGSNEKEHLSQEVSALKMAVERAERNMRQETSRFQAEVASLRQRLDRADADLLHARKENLRLTEQIASLEKELHFSKLTSEEKESGLSKDSKREKELTSMIMDMDSKHVKNIAELEGLIQSQTQLMEKLKDECHVLTQKLEDSSIRHNILRNFLSGREGDDKRAGRSSRKRQVKLDVSVKFSPSEGEKFSVKKASEDGDYPKRVRRRTDKAKEDRSNLTEQNEKLLERLSQVWQNCKELHQLCAECGVTFPLSLSDIESDGQMTPLGWENMNSRSMMNSPSKDEFSPLKLEDLISLSPRSLQL